LRLLKTNEGAVEADLQQYYGIDYRDRWRGDLTLRRIFVLVNHLPLDSSTFAEGGQRWGWTDHLVDDLRIVMSSSEKQKSEPHPARPGTGKNRKPDPQRETKLAALRKRQEERAARLQKGATS